MNEATVAEDGVRTYRGESIEALLPQIRAELGPDAVILKQREGLVGGVGGFFQKRCVEVDARAGGPGIDVYDEQPSVAAEEPDAVEEPAAPMVRNDAATREGLATPAVQELVAQAHPFAEMLAEARPEAEVEAPPKVRALIDGMVEAGLGRDLARELVEAVLASAMPFATPGRLRTLVRNELALRIPVARAAAPGPRTLVFLGPAGAGKTSAMTAIRAAHEAAGTAAELTLLDAPEPGEAAALEGAEAHLVLRAGTAGPAASEAIDAAAPLAPTHLLLSGAGETRHLGGVVDAAIRSGLPLSYVAESATEIAPAEPRGLAGRLVP
jgi:flagellar biosynthesis protein FlhF